MQVALFITCFNDTLFPNTGIATTRLLERLGHTVDFPEAQTCCGQMHYNTGYQKEAFPMMRHFLDVFQGTEAICIPSASCVAMIRDHYPKMARETNEQSIVNRVDELLPCVYEFSELLVDKLGVTEVGAFYPHTVTLHTSCHSLRSLHVGDKPVQLLKKVVGLQLIELPESDQCCGLAARSRLRIQKFQRQCSPISCSACSRQAQKSAPLETIPALCTLAGV